MCVRVCSEFGCVNQKCAALTRAASLLQSGYSFPRETFGFCGGREFQQTGQMLLAGGIDECAVHCIAERNFYLFPFTSSIRTNTCREMCVNVLKSV